MGPQKGSSAGEAGVQQHVGCESSLRRGSLSQPRRGTCHTSPSRKTWLTVCRTAVGEGGRYSRRRWWRPWLGGPEET